MSSAMAYPPVAGQTPTLPSQFPMRARAPSSSQMSATLRRDSEQQLRTGSSSGPPHNMTENTPFGDATTLKGDYSGDALTLKGDHSPGYSDDGHHHHRHKLHRVTSKLETPRKWMGLQPAAPVAEIDPDHVAHVHLGWSQTKLVFKEPFAEFWGTFILVLFGKYCYAACSAPTN